MIHYGLINSNSQAILDNSEPVSTLSCQCSSCCGLASQNQEILSDSAISPSMSVADNEVIPDDNLAQEVVDSLFFGSQWGGRTITYSFYENDVFNGDYYGSETEVSEVSEDVKVNVREILQILETFTDLNFVEVEETNSNTFGQIRYLLSEDPAYAYAYFPNVDPSGGDIHLNPDYQDSFTTNGFENGSGEHGFTALIHETLHALGLKHPHEATFGNDVTLDPNLDNLSTTVLTSDFTGSSPATPQPYDIAALQQLYGVGEHNQGDDLYVFGDRTDTYTLNGDFFFADANRLKQTIWDTGGNDTLDFSSLELQSQGYLFDLTQGGRLIAIDQEGVIGEETYYDYGTSLAYEVVIENVIGSTSNDTIIANSAANTISGYQLGRAAGDDILVGTDSFDTLLLSGYLDTEVSQTRDDQDLLVDLGTDGSIFIQDYYAVPESDRLNIQFGEALNELELSNFDQLSPAIPEDFEESELDILNIDNPELDVSESSATEPLITLQNDLLVTEPSPEAEAGFTYQTANPVVTMDSSFSESDLVNVEDDSNLLVAISPDQSEADLSLEVESLDVEIDPGTEQLSSLAIADSNLIATPVSLISSNTNSLISTTNNFDVDLAAREDLTMTIFNSQLEFSV